MPTRSLPSPLLSSISLVRGGARLLAVTGASAAFYGALRAEHRGRPVPRARRDRYVQRWAQLQLTLLAVEQHIAGLDHVRERTPGPCLLVSNHRSALDIAALLQLCGGVFLARGDLAGWPGMGTLARAAGTVFVDRDDPGSRAGAIRRVGERLAQGETVLVFPEGTTFPGDEVRRFQAGAFLPLLRSGGVVLPVGLAYDPPEAIFREEEDFPTHYGRLLRLPRCRLSMVIGAALPAQGKAEALARAAQQAVQALVNEARARLSAGSPAPPPAPAGSAAR